jgi:hypothetical protein
MFIVNHANKFLQENRVVRRVAMAAAGSPEITVRGDAWPDAGARMTNWNL